MKINKENQDLFSLFSLLTFPGVQPDEIMGKKYISLIMFVIFLKRWEHKENQ